MKIETPDYDYEKEITWIGILSSIFVAFIFILWTGKLSDHHAIGWSVALGITLQLSLWFSIKKFKNYGFSLLGVMFFTMVLSLIPFSKFFLLAASIYLLSLFILKSSFSLDKKKLTLILTVISLAIIYGTMTFLSTSRNIGDAFIDEKVRQLTLNPDTLFFSAMSTMFKNYNIIATGLHGLRWEHYHVLAFMIYGRIASLLDIKPVQVYGYVNYIVFAPLLFCGYLRLANSFQFNSKYKWVLINLIIFSFSFSYLFGLGDSNFGSESYLMGLLFLSGALLLLVDFIQKSSISVLNFLFLTLYLPILSISKISVGFIFSVALLIAILLKEKISYFKRFAMLFSTIIFCSIGYHISRTTAIPGFYEVRFKWNYYRDLSTHPNIFQFYFKMFPLFFLALPLFFILLISHKLSRDKFIWFSILFGTVAIGFLALNMTIDSSGSYFSDISIYFFITLILLIFSEEKIILPSSLKYFRANTHLLSFYLIFILGVGIFSSLFFFIKIAPNEFDMVRKIRGQIISHHKQNENPYSILLEKIKSDPDKNTMIYIPKKELEYWKNADDTYAPWSVFHCIAMSFYIPILSGKPAVFGLPIDPIKCDMLFRGFEEYTPAEYEASQAKDYSDQDVCNAVTGFGFKNFYRVTAVDGIKKIYCKNTI